MLARTIGTTPATLQKFKRYHQHPNITHDNCFWNKKYKGFRPKWIYDKMDIKYKRRHKFSADMGGYPLDSEDE